MEQGEIKSNYISLLLPLLYFCLTIIDHHESFITSIINEIQGAIGDCKDNTEAAKLNVKNTINKIKRSEIINELLENDVEIVGSIYHTHSGEVEILK